MKIIADIRKPKRKEDISSKLEILTWKKGTECPFCKYNLEEAPRCLTCRRAFCTNCSGCVGAC